MAESTLANANRIIDDTGARLYVLEAENERMAAKIERLEAERAEMLWLLRELLIHSERHYGNVDTENFGVGKTQANVRAILARAADR